MSTIAAVNYTSKFQAMCDIAIAAVEQVAPGDVDAAVLAGAVTLDIRDPDEHAIDFIAGENALHCSRGKLEMNIEKLIPDLTTPILTYCNVMNRGALSAHTLVQMGYVNAKFIADCGHHKQDSVDQENVCALNKEGICNHQLHKIRSRDEFGAMATERNFTIGAELGVQNGWYSDMFLYGATTMKKYILVDTWEQRSNYSDNANVDNAAQEATLKHCRQRLSPYSHRTQLDFMRMWTTEAAKKVPDNSVDFIYVDARHDYCGVMEDIEAWWPKLRPGGVMAGDDYLTEPEHIEIKGGLRDPNDDWGLCGNGSRFQGAVKGAVLQFAHTHGVEVYSTWKNDISAREMKFWPQWIYSAKKDSDKTAA